jgi:methylthioribose-1-phosphate isomerase
MGRKGIIISVLAIVLVSCKTQRIWTVKSYAEVNGMWEMQCQSGNKTRVYVTDCKPDSIGSKFKY